MEGVATGLTFGFPRWLSPSSVATRDNRSKLHSPLAAPSVRASAIDASIIALGLTLLTLLTLGNAQMHLALLSLTRKGGVG